VSGVSPVGLAVQRGIALIAVTNLSREWLRSLLILITIMLATLLFLTSLSSLNGFSKPIDDMLSNQRASHALLDFDTRIYDPVTIASWWQSQRGVQSVSPLLPHVVTPGRPVYKGKELGSYFKLTEAPVRPMAQDHLVFIEGAARPYPSNGEIWLPSSAARSANIHTGDVLEIPTSQGARALTVSGIVVDPHYSSGFVNPERAWVGPGELAFMFPASSLHSYTIGIRLESPDEFAGLWNAFNESLGSSFSGSLLSYDKVVSSYSFMVRMLGMLLLVFAAVSLLLALFIISSTISSEILSSYRTFGILKSLGYTPGNVVSIFQVQFLVLSLFAVPLGVWGSYHASDWLIRLMLQSIGTAGIEGGFLNPAILTFVSIPLLIVGAAGLAGKKAGKVKPASAIRFGAPEASVHRSPVHIQLARYLPIALVITLKNLATVSRRQLFDFASILATAFVLMFSVNVYHSITLTDQNLPFWGLDGADVTVRRATGIFGLSYSSLMEYLRADSKVKFVAGYGSQSVTLPNRDGFTERDLNGHVIDGSLDEMGYINLLGQNPQADDEISIGMTIAKDYEVGVGDRFPMVVLGQPLEFTVSGIFQGTTNSGYWYRTTADSVRRANPQFEPNSFLVVLRDGVDRDAYMSELEAQLGQAVDTEPSEKLVQTQLSAIVRNLGLVLGFLSITFVLVSAVSIANSTAIGIFEARRQLGIFKALGFTQPQVRFIIIGKSGITGLLAVGVGAILCWMLAEPIMSALMAQVGMSTFPLHIDLIGSLLVVPVVVAIALAGAWFPSGRVVRQKPRALLAE